MIKSQQGIESAVRLSSSLQSSTQEDKMSVVFQQPIGKPLRSYYIGSNFCLMKFNLAIESLQSQSHSATWSEPSIPIDPVSRAFRRCNSKSSRPSSLLQRGRSFTAADLQIEDEKLEVDNRGRRPLTEKGEQASSSTRVIGIRQHEKRSRPIQPMTALTPQSTSQTSSKPPATLIRSKSSYSVAHAAPYSSQKMFLSTPQPSTAKSYIMPRSLQPSMSISVSKSRRTNNEGGHDLPDSKKIKRIGGNGYQAKPGRISIPHQYALTQGGLQSPFEEKRGLNL